MSLSDFHLSATYTDQYQLTMAQVYFLDGQENNTAVFDYHFRSLPFDGGYAVFAGLADALEIVENLRFNEEDIRFLHDQGLDSKFLEYLKSFRFKGHIYSSREGDLVFPTRPVLMVRGSILEAQIIETILLNILNFQTLIATKASRIRLAAGDAHLLDFGLRRAQGLGGYSASRASMIGGFDGTSNTLAARDYGIPVSGTMAHSLIQNYEDELLAFQTFARHRPVNCTLLVDTYDTLKSGVPNAIKVGLEMKEKGQKLLGIRLDSGDLAYLARESRKMLDEAGLPEVKIAASNQLDEYVIRSLINQGAPIDIYGVGTNLVTGNPDANLDGVYKLCFSNGKPRMKFSENIQKMNLPHQKQVYRILNEDGTFYGAEAVTLNEEKEVEEMIHPFDDIKQLDLQGYHKEPLLHQVMKNGSRVESDHSWKKARAHHQTQLKKLPQEYKRFDNPHIYKIGISPKLKEERTRLINSHLSNK